MEDNKVPGIMEVGVPGVGKTHGPKALCNKHNIPLILADVGAMKEGEVGRSEGNVRAFLKLALAVSGGKLLAVGTTNSTANLSPQLMSRFRYTFMFDIPDEAGRAAAWKIYIKQYQLGPKQIKEMPDDKNWTPREIRNCCEAARALEYNLKEAAKFICPVFKSGAADIAKLRAEANGRYLSDSKPGFYEAPKVELGLRPGGRAISN
jgi:SpoVK/Ycf46/Vps4 family AAA+-type ATPase